MAFVAGGFLLNFSLLGEVLGCQQGYGWRSPTELRKHIYEETLWSFFAAGTLPSKCVKVSFLFDHRTIVSTNARSHGK